MSKQETEKCEHRKFLDMYDQDMCPTFDFETPCPDCGKTQGDIFQDPDDIDPTTRMSQQPHGDHTYYCNACQQMVKPIQFEENEECCPYHQRTYSDGTQLYDSEEPDDDW